MAITPHFAALVFTALLLATSAHATSFDVDRAELATTARQEGEERCSSIRLPGNLCTACPLRPFTGTGRDVTFGGINRYDIYNLTSERCKNALAEYARRNPCDTRRARAAARMLASPGRSDTRGFIYFMYSVCETCCDCIPIGARADEYADRKAAKSLLRVERGNCAAHFHFDTCAVWPQVGHITGRNGALRDDRPVWCPDFEAWQNSSDSKGWIRNNDVDGITKGMRRAMKQLTKRARCNEERQWKNCVGLERAQERI